MTKSAPQISSLSVLRAGWRHALPQPTSTQDLPPADGPSNREPISTSYASCRAAGYQPQCRHGGPRLRRGLGKKVLQLQLYLTETGPCGRNTRRCGRSRAIRARPFPIDRLTFPVSVLFAGDYAVLADGQAGAFPSLSEALLEAMQAGSRMTLHFDLVEERPGQSRRLRRRGRCRSRSPVGRQAVAAMRRCASPGGGAV